MIPRFLLAAVFSLTLFLPSSLFGQPPGHLDTPDLSPRQKAELSLLRKQYDEALKGYQGLLRQNPNDSYVFRGLVKAWVGTGRKADAENYIKEHLTHHPNSSAALYGLGYLYYQWERDGEAEQFLRRAMESGPRNALAFNNLGAVLARKKSFEEAARLVKKAIEIDSAEPMFFYNLQIIYKDAGLPHRFIEEFEEYKKTGPPRVALGYAKIMIKSLRQEGFKLYSQGSLDDAIAKFTRMVEVCRAIDYKQGLVPGLFALGLLFEEKKDNAKALKYFREVLQISPRHIQAREKLKTLAVPDP